MSTETVAGTTDRRIATLLALFANNPMIVISGARIAREIGVSRSTVWRWVERLRSLDVKVKGHRSSGYVIEKVPDLLLPNLLRPRLRGNEFGKHIHHFFKTDSTNRVALELGHAGDAQGTLVLAEEQTAGRGRASRNWYSERASGIYMSLLLRPKLAPADAPLITLLAGLSAREAILQQTGCAADLRWPNDLLLGGKKLGGILTEMYAEPGRVRFVVVGIGLNVNQPRFPEKVASIATSLRMESGRVHSRLELLLRLLQQFESGYNRFLNKGASPLLAEFAAASSYAQGKRVRITDGNESFTGTTAGLEPSGLLRVKRDDGSVFVVVSGDVAEVP